MSSISDCIKRLQKINFSKDRFIDAIDDLSFEEKEKYKDFFNTHREQESKINWQGKNVLEEIENVYNEYVEKNDIHNQFDNEDFIYIDENDQYIFYQVTTWNGAKYANSYNNGGQGAKWCTGNSSIGKWEDYTDNGDIFVLVYNKDKYANENERKWMIQYNTNTKKLQCWNQDNNVEDCLYGNDIINKFNISFDFDSLDTNISKNNLEEFREDTKEEFTTKFGNKFVNGFYQCSNTISIELENNISEYNDITVNNVIENMMYTFADEITENSIVIRVNKDIHEPIKFELKGQIIYTNIQLYGYNLTNNLIQYANSYSDIPLIENCLLKNNFSNFISNWDIFKIELENMSSDYSWEINSNGSNITVIIKDSYDNIIQIINDFSNKLNIESNNNLEINLDYGMITFNYGFISKIFDINIEKFDKDKFEELANIIGKYSIEDIEKILDMIEINESTNEIYIDGIKVNNFNSISTILDSKLSKNGNVDNVKKYIKELTNKDCTIRIVDDHIVIIGNNISIDTTMGLNGIEPYIEENYEINKKLVGKYDITSYIGDFGIEYDVTDVNTSRTYRELSIEGIKTLISH